MSQPDRFAALRHRRLTAAQRHSLRAFPRERWWRAMMEICCAIGPRSSFFHNISPLVRLGLVEVRQSPELGGQYVRLTLLGAHVLELELGE